jgi:hypothetical protein
MWTFLAAEEPASLIVPDSVQKANLAEAVSEAGSSAAKNVHIIPFFKFVRQK